jgi:F-type H+-transporting ATPase subunit b
MIRSACERGRKRAGLAAAVALAAAWLAGPGTAIARAHDLSPAQTEPAAAVPASPGHGATEEHDAGSWVFVGRIVNFAILAGTLFYLARKPLAQYLADRAVQIRNDLRRAAEMKDDAGRQIAEIDAKLKQLPGELDALRARGRDEVLAEETRIDEAATAERDRLLEQTRREIDQQLRLARRDLVTHAADLAVQVARERIADRITTDDQARLVERYLSQVRTHD